MEELLAVERNRNEQLAQTLQMIDEGGKKEGTADTNTPKRAAMLKSPNVSLNSSGLSMHQVNISPIYHRSIVSTPSCYRTMVICPRC